MLLVWVPAVVTDGDDDDDDDDDVDDYYAFGWATYMRTCICVYVRVYVCFVVAGRQASHAEGSPQK